jgi:hypothetical protein
MPCDVCYRDRFIHASQLDLSLFIGLLIRIIDREHEGAWYRTARDRWAYEVINSGNNLLDLRMDDLITGPDDLQRMKDLLSRLQDEIKSYGEFMPHTEANSLVPATMWYNKDVSVERLCEKVAEIATLCRGPTDLDNRTSGEENTEQ